MVQDFMETEQLVENPLRGLSLEWRIVASLAGLALGLDGIERRIQSLSLTVDHTRHVVDELTDLIGQQELLDFLAALSPGKE